jgi:hypothetical protein
MVPHILHLLLLFFNPHIRKTFHLDLLLVLKNLHPHRPPPCRPKNTDKLASPHPQDTPNIPSPPTPNHEKKEKLATPHPQETPNIPSPPPRPPPSHPPPPHETTKPTPPNGSAQNNHAKAGTFGPNTSVIGPGETPLLPVNQSDVLAGADKSVDDISKKVVGTSGPNTSVIAPGGTPLGKKVLEKPSAISISKERNLPKIKSLHHVQQAKNPLRNLQPFQSCKKRNLPKIKALHHLQQASKPLRNLLQPSPSSRKRKLL